MKAKQWIEILSFLPEIEALLECAHRSGVRFGLCGGVLRNLLLSEGQNYGNYESLYNFVDPFGDIDLVFLSELDQNSLARLLYQAVPFADCHSWDFQTAAFAKEAALRNGLVSADRLVLWFDGLEEPRLSFGSFEGDVDEHLATPLKLQKTFKFGPERGNPVGRFLEFIKYMRIQLQAPGRERTRQMEFGDYLGHLGELLRTWNPQRRQSLWRGRISRAEIELGQLILNAANWPETLRYLRQLRESVSGEWMRTSEALVTMLGTNLESAARLGMALYRPRARASYRFEVNTSQSEEETARDAFRSRIPWTRLTLRNARESSCCPYSDFEEGIGVIAWRNSGGGGTRQDEDLQVRDYGVVVRPVISSRELPDVFGEDDLIPMSGYTRKGRSIAIRLDTAYLKLITGGRYSTFLVGLLPISNSEEIEGPTPRNPRALSPEGETGGEPVWEESMSRKRKINLTPTRVVAR